MTRKKLFMTVQAVLCAVIAVLLAAGALSLYLDGAAKQAEGDLFYYMFTRERAGAKLLPVCRDSTVIPAPAPSPAVLWVPCRTR